MKRSLLALLTCVALAVSAGGGVNQIHPERTYPRFQIGVTGIWATIEPGRQVTVDSAEAGSPAEGKVQKGDAVYVHSGGD